MSVTNTDLLRGMYTGVKALGNKAINSDAWFEIEGYEQMGLVTKQFPWPVLGVIGNIEVAGPAGMMMTQPQQVKIVHESPISFSETITGMVHRFTRDIIRNSGGVFNATVYEGTPERFYRAVKLRDCFFQPDNIDRDWENRSQVVMINGTLHFHFFGEEVPGNIVA